jgi:hypothetical protein
MSGTWLIYATNLPRYMKKQQRAGAGMIIHILRLLFSLRPAKTVTTRTTRLYQTRGKLGKVIRAAAHAFPSTRIAGIRLLKPRVANPRNPAQIPSCLMTIHCASVVVLPTRSTMMKAVIGSSARYSTCGFTPLRARGYTPV